MAIFFCDLENEVKGQIQGHENIRHILFPICPFWFLCFKVNNKQVISHFLLWPWKWARMSNSRSWEHSAYIIPYISTIDSLAPKSIISMLIAIFFFDLENEVEFKFKVMKTFGIYDSLYVHNWLLSSKVDNKQVIGHFVQWPWKWGRRSNSRSQKHSAYMIPYMSTIDS